VHEQLHPHGLNELMHVKRSNRRGDHVLIVPTPEMAHRTVLRAVSAVKTMSFNYSQCYLYRFSGTISNYLQFPEFPLLFPIISKKRQLLIWQWSALHAGLTLYSAHCDGRQLDLQSLSEVVSVLMLWLRLVLPSSAQWRGALSYVQCGTYMIIMQCEACVRLSSLLPNKPKKTT